MKIHPQKLKTVIFILSQLLISTFLFAQTASGFVFLDSNGNGVKESNEKGLQGICVSNGTEVVQTNSKGQWKLPVNEDAGLFVIKPTNYQVPLNKSMLPQYYYLHKPDGSPQLKVEGVKPSGKLPKSIDFPLVYKLEPEKFSALFFGDTQASSPKEVNYINHDVVESLIGTTAKFGITLGDIVGHDQKLFKGISEGIAQIGIPWYYIFGNHDNNGDATENKYRDETFERYFGPSTYAFEMGKVVFIGFNNVYFNSEGKYISHFSLEQVNFLKNYLNYVSNDKLIVLMMHIPIFTCENKELIFDLLKDRPHTFSISGHVHDQMNVFVDQKYGWTGQEPHHHLINATVCGSWWAGQIDEVGIPHATMNDGAPNGYSILNFDGNKYKVQFKAARRPDSYQMNIYAPNEISIDSVTSTKILINVFAGSEKSVVQMSVGKDEIWTTLKKINGKDPEVARMHKLFPVLKLKYDGEEIENTLGWAMDRPSISKHMWEGKLPKGLKEGPYTIKVKTKDMYGQIWEANRIIYIK